MLAAQEDAYQDKLVRTQGVVRMFEPPRHYWLEDHESNRVGLEPAELAAPLLGQVVRVVGCFTFDEQQGRVIRIQEIAPALAPPQPTKPTC